jgi:tripartite-type tricarboxylate transporter receptor subunit TctC
VRALAVLDAARAPTLPNVPTAKEAGIANYEVLTWYGVLAPAATPREIVARLNTEWVKIAAMPDTREKMTAAGFDTMAGTSEQFRDFIRSEMVRWGRVIKDANLVIEQ